MNTAFQETSIGRIGIAEENGLIVRVLFPRENPASEVDHKETRPIREAFRQLREYLDRKRKKFDLPLNPQGTEFMRSVWSKLQEVPYGQTASYKDIAEAVGHPKAYRAVGLANNRNPIPLFIPCHRIIGANGKLVGFGGGLELKQQLLDLERTI